MSQVKVQNWKASITYYANSVEAVTSVEDIVRIVSDRERYPAPVRARGSHHSTTRCIVAEDGTVVDMSGMNRILGIDEAAQTITMQAGVLHIDAARELERHGLQFEYGQVASYVVDIKAVLADGSLLHVTEADAELMQAMRSSYGMLGIIYEVTYRVKEIRPLAVRHLSYHVDEFADRLDELIAGQRSMMLYLFPFLDRVVVEYRYDGDGPMRSNSWQWRLRNWVWKTGSPFFGKIVTLLVPGRRLRSWIFDAYNRLSQWVIVRVIRDTNSSPADQIIRYPETAGFSSYTFSIWAFPREQYAQTIRAYYRFCKDYFDRSGYRCDLLNVGYFIARDTRSLFSYTSHGDALTLDPVSTGSRGWNDFLVAYNEFCSEHNGTPLFNQTHGITPRQAQKAFGPEISRFLEFRRRYDPDNRYYSVYFRNLFEPGI
jgi:FAD/FMN-containing dehydrogenase